MGKDLDRLDAIQKDMLRAAILKGATIFVCQSCNVTRSEINKYRSMNPDFNDQYQDSLRVGEGLRALKIEIAGREVLGGFVDDAIAKGKTLVGELKSGYAAFAKEQWEDIQGKTLTECKEWIKTENALDRSEIEEIMELADEYK